MHAHQDELLPVVICNASKAHLRGSLRGSQARSVPSPTLVCSASTMLSCCLRKVVARSAQRSAFNAVQQPCLSTVPEIADTDDEKIMGMAGTSVTRKLWQDRLTKNRERLQHLPLSAPKGRPPHKIAVTYPLGSDRFLQEQVRGTFQFNPADSKLAVLLSSFCLIVSKPMGSSAGWQAVGRLGFPGWQYSV